MSNAIVLVDTDTDRQVQLHTAPDLSAIWQVAPGQADMAMLQLWYRLRDQWLKMQTSSATRNSYATGSLQWLDWLANQDLFPWQVVSSHVRAWQEWLTASGKSPSTVGQRMSAVSSWYQFVINEIHMVDGVERSAFFDANGNNRANPFKVGNIKRPKVTQYGKATPMHPHQVRDLFAFLRSRLDTVSGARNYALILSHLLTASRGSEIVRLKWQDIRPNTNQVGSYVFAWSGKGDKSATSPFPADAYNAIVAYLKLSGRWIPGHPDSIQDDDYIFTPLVTHGLANLMHVDADDADYATPGARHISSKSAQRILQSSLRKADIDKWRDYRIHDLRHTFAHTHYKLYHDLEGLRDLLHHNNIATTGIYVRNMDDPVDTHSQAIMAQLGLI